MRRKYAFESEGVSDAVKTQLEKVEDAAAEKCSTPEDCDKILEKIDDQKEKFDDALKTMASAAKDCKDGKCDDAEMAAKITPKMAELKSVAKEIGVATEAETVSEDELKDVKEYLTGAEEIVEARKDELENGDSDKDSGDDEDEDDEAAVEAAINAMGYSSMDDFISACEAETSHCNIAMESYEIAMEGYNWETRREYKEKRDEIKDLVKQARAAAKQGDEAKAKELMNKAVSGLKEYKQYFVEACKENQGAGKAILGFFAYAFRGFGLGLLASLTPFGLGTTASKLVGLKHDIEFWVDVIQAITKAAKGKELSASDFNLYTKSIEHNMDILIARYESVAKSIDVKAAKNAAKNAEKDAAATANESFTEFIAACESMQFGVESSNKKGPFLFN